MRYPSSPAGWHTLVVSFLVSIRPSSAADFSELPIAVVDLGGVTSSGRQRPLSVLVSGVCVKSGLFRPLDGSCPVPSISVIAALAARRSPSPSQSLACAPCVSITEPAATGLSAVSTAVWSGPSVSPPAGRRRCLSVMFIDLSVYNSTSPLDCSRVSRSISRGVTLLSAAAI